MRHWFSLGLLCCASLLVSACTDLNAPVIYYTGLSTTAIAPTSITISWNKASDGLSPQTALVYKVYYCLYPTCTSFKTIGEVEAGTPVTTPTNVDIDTATITVPAANSAYYINVVVQDEAGNKSVYDPLGEFVHASQVNYYPFSGNAYDVTASLNHLVATTLTSTTITTVGLPTSTLDRFGHPASAYNFNATATSAQCLQSTNPVDVSLTGSSARTVSFWVQSANTTTPAVQRSPFAWGDGSTNGSAFGAYETGIGSHWTAWLGGTSVGDTGAAATTNWEHWIIGYDGANVVAYKNGVLATTTPSALAAATAAGLLYVGCAASPAGTLVNPYLGKIDDLRVFNVLLTATDVGALYNATKP